MEEKEITNQETSEQTNTQRFATSIPRETDDKKEKKSCDTKKKCCVCKSIFYIIIVLAIAGLYFLHFYDKGGKKTTTSFVSTGTPGNGEILYVDLDSISEHYELMKILTADIEQEIQRQTAIFDNKEKTFQKKYNQFQQNYQAGILTEIQIQNAQQQLQEEYQSIMAERERVLTDLDNRQATALAQVMDSLSVVSAKVNAERYGASYVLGYKAGTQILYGDPTKNITDEVLEELNKHYKK